MISRGYLGSMSIFGASLVDGTETLKSVRSNI